MKNVVTFARAIGDPTRWRIVRLVLNEALCVCELTDILAMPHSSISSHVQILRRAGLLESEKREKWTYFQISDAYLDPIHNLLQFFGSADRKLEGQDAKRATARLSKREHSCCPGPLRLKSRKFPAPLT